MKKQKDENMSHIQHELIPSLLMRLFNFDFELIFRNILYISIDLTGFSFHLQYDRFGFIKRIAIERINHAILRASASIPR